MKARLISVLLVIALLVTVGVVTAQAAVATDTAAATLSAEAVKSQSAEGQLTVSGDTATGYCAACKANVTDWIPLPAATSDNVPLEKNSHYFVKEDMSNKKSYTVASSTTTHVHLNGKTLSSTASVFSEVTANSSKLYIMGDGVVTSSANITISSGGQTHLMGGTYKNTAANSVVVFNTSPARPRTIYIYEGTTIEGTVQVNHTATCGSLIIYGGTIDKVIAPTKATSGAGSQSFKISGKPQIAELDISYGYYPNITDLDSDARIGVLKGTAISGSEKATQVTGGYETEAEVKSGCFYPVDRATYTLRVKTTSGAKYYLALEENEGVETCEVCGKRAFFTPVTAADAQAGELPYGHYRVTEDLQLDGALAVSRDVCIDLDGNDVTSIGLVLKQTAGSLYVFGGGTITGAAASGNAATIEATGDNVTLKDCTIKHTSESEKTSVYIVRSGAVAKLEGVTLTADEGVKGRNLYTEIATMEISNCLIENGTSTTYGGNIYNKGTDITFSDTIVRNGTAESRGGNIYTETGTMLYESGTQILSVLPEDITETTAYTAKDGGNIYHRSGTSYFEEGCVVSGGYASNNGGSILAYAGSVHFQGGTFTGGQADRGAFLAQVPDNAYSQNNSAVYIYGGTFDEGTLNPSPEGDRGKTFLSRGGKLTVTGGTFNSTSDGSDGKEIGCAINIAPTEFTAELILTESTKAAEAGPGIVINDDQKFAIRISSSEKAKLTVTSRFNDDIVLRYEGLDYGDVAGVYTPVKNVDYTGSVVVSNPDLNGVPLLHDGNNNLVVANVKVGDAWYTAQQAYENEEISEFQLLGDATLTVAAENSAKVDLNGKNIAVTGSGTFNGTNSTSAKAGVATLGADVKSGITNGYSVSDWVPAAHGGYYNIAIEQANEEGKIASYHKLEMAMKNISLRTGDVGLYYTSEIKADETLAAMINSAGVLLGATNEGGEGNMANLMLDAKASDLDKTDGAFRGVGIENPDLSKVTSVLVKNIFKAGATNNAERGKVRIVGTPYVKFVTGDVLVCQDVVDYSMKQFLDTADAQITDQTKLGALKNFCDTWNVASFGWTLPNILGTAPAEPEV